MLGEAWKEHFYNKHVKPFLKYETEAAERIKNIYNVDIISFNDDNKYDFIDSNNIKYEVKADLYSNSTDNFFIEYYGYDKPSGIKTTQANNYIITDGINYYLIDTNKLKKLCCGAKVKTTKNNLTYGYIINKSIIISNSHFI